MDLTDDSEWLRRQPCPAINKGDICAVDLFAGGGGMSLGFEAAALSQGFTVSGLAIESDPEVANTYSRNFPRVTTTVAAVEGVFDGIQGATRTLSEESVKSALGSVQVLMGGPPCQGHSDLNNHTRRNDPRNALYLRMARAAEVLEPCWVVIENVPSVVHDKSRVVAKTVEVLEGSGYSVDHRVMGLGSLGVPQTRRRHILLACRHQSDPSELLDALARHRFKRTVRWAIGDLEDHSGGHMDQPARKSPDNAARMKHLFDNGLFDLPNELRPRCHRDGNHSYKSVYGRLRWDLPAPTITTGFSSMGQGRYVHPSRERTLTPHEAARLQTFPDWYDWNTDRRTVLSSMIGNAVPPIVMKRLGQEIVADLARCS